MGVWDVGRGFFGAIGEGDNWSASNATTGATTEGQRMSSVPGMLRGLERWQRRRGPSANEEVAVAKQSIARTEIIGRIAVGCVLTGCIQHCF